MTASNLIGPLVQTLDRFIIAGLATAAVVASYTVPSEMMLRLLIIPGALASALFPKLASELAWSGHEGRLLYRKSVKIIVLTMSALCLLMAVGRSDEHTSALQSLIRISYAVLD